MACVALSAAGGALAQAPAAKPAAAAAAQPAFPVLDRAQVDALLKTPDKVVFLDVRRADEISDIGGLPVFLNIQAADVERYLAYIPRDRKIVTVSNHAGRATKTALLLKQHGLNVVGAVGVQNYEAQGGTLTGKKPAVQAAAK